MKRYRVGLLLAPLLWGMVVPVAPAAGLSLEARVERLERRAARITELTLAVDALRRENSELRGQIETLSHELERLRRRQRDLYLDIDQRLSAVGRGASGAAAGNAADAGTAPVAVPGDAAPAVADAPKVETDPQAAERDYQAAYALLDPRVKRYEEAAAAFTGFLERHPDSPLAANARYWLGEAYYVMQRNAEARAAFESLIERHPDSPKVPGALYKLGRLLAAEGDIEGARRHFRRVIERHPDAPSAELARERLRRLDARH